MPEVLGAEREGLWLCPPGLVHVAANKTRKFHHYGYENGYCKRNTCHFTLAEVLVAMPFYPQFSNCLEIQVRESLRGCKTR